MARGCFFAHLEGIDGDTVVLAVLLTEQAAVGDDVLVLLSNRLLQPDHFNFDGLLRQHFRIDRLAFKSVHGVNETNQEGSGRTQAGAGGYIRDADDLDRIRHIVELHHFADELVAYLVFGFG